MGSPNPHWHGLPPTPIGMGSPNPHWHGLPPTPIGMGYPQPPLAWVTPNPHWHGLPPTPVVLAHVHMVPPITFNVGTIATSMLPSAILLCKIYVYAIFQCNIQCDTAYITHMHFSCPPTCYIHLASLGGGGGARQALTILHVLPSANSPRMHPLTTMSNLQCTTL